MSLTKCETVERMDTDMNEPEPERKRKKCPTCNTTIWWREPNLAHVQCCICRFQMWSNQENFMKPVEDVQPQVCNAPCEACDRGLL